MVKKMDNLGKTINGLGAIGLLLLAIMIYMKLYIVVGMGIILIIILLINNFVDPKIEEEEDEDC